MVAEKHSRNLWALGIVALAAAMAFLAWLGDVTSIAALKIEGAGYAHGVTPAAGQPSLPSAPAPVGRVRRAHTVTSMAVSLEFTPAPPAFYYGNLFQTADTAEAFRIELQPSGNLVLVFAGGAVFPVAGTIQPNRPHQLHVSYERDHEITIQVDRREALKITEKRLLARSPELSNVIVGTGLAQQRSFVGTIQNFSLHASYSFVPRRATIARWLVLLLGGWLFLRSIALPGEWVPVPMAPAAAHTADHDLPNALLALGVVLGAVALTLLGVHALGGENLGRFKWLAHLVLSLAVLAAALVLRARPVVPAWVAALASLPLLAYVGFVVFANAQSFNATDGIAAAIGIFALLGLLNYQTGALPLRLGGLRSWFWGHWGAVALTGGVFLVAWLSFGSLTNWDAYRRALQTHYVFTVLGSFLVLRLVLEMIFVAPRPQALSSGAGVAPGRNTPDPRFPRVALDVAVLAVLLWASFRHDTLFIPGSEYHWEYYVGVVQGVRNGGWLLWDTPSQYGFLNILLASLVPSASAWQSFYIFQGVLLFLVSTGIYLATRYYISTSVFHRVIVFAIVFMALFFADPELIGPYPFPSSSVVRFFCVYALVLVAWFIPKFGLRQAIALSIVWSLSVIWSAESAIYGTAIYFFILVALLLARATGNHRYVLASKYVAIAATCLAAVFATLYVFYFAWLGVAPDLFSFFEHAIGYAGGYGYVPFSLTGPGNLLLLLFMAISILCIGVVRRGGVADEGLVSPLAAMAGCIWGISTYYIGRPVPQNITAMLPLIAMAAYLALMLSKRMSQGAYSLPIKAAALPLFFLVLIPLFNLKWVENLAQIQSFASDVTTKLPKATNELQQLLSRAKPSADTPIVYYGDDAAPPIFSGGYARLNETNWLPIPLQLLETPVSEARRSLYLNRYICRNQPSGGILVNRKGDAIAVRLQGFLHELRQFYDVEEAISGNAYTLYRFSGMNLQHCPTAVGNKAS